MTPPPGPAAALPDVFDPRQYADGVPYDRYRTLRDHHPVARQEEPAVLGWPAGPGFWAVTRHADVTAVLRDPATYSSCLGATQIRDPDPEDLPFIRRMMLNQDPPGHGRLRTSVSRAFTPRRVARFEERARERARTLLGWAVAGARAGDGTCDLVPAVTDDYALLNLADLLGVPDSDRELLLHWTQRVIGYQDPDEAGEPTLGPDGRPVNPRSPAMLADMFAYATELAAHKRRHPGDDLLTALATTPELAAGELEMFFFLLTVAGNDTVRGAAPGGVLALVEHPDELRALRTGAAPVPGAVEELLRWHPPVLTFRRTAARDTELAGVRIRRGDKVVVFHAAANRDERVFAEPDRLDLRRTPNPHVSFGGGPHVCLGAHFARLQLAVFYEEFLAAVPQPRPAGVPRRLVSHFINSLKSLPLRVAD
ncbi:cytochrome P450 [Streptomyces flavofungini]|uniref:Cytochrome P450 n=1 Tax=Streptomyces flavofungini TaxID=68200 RepID=A0ABS0X8P8_9ACTN|nr:cytochrome P450 [Streptomyces flavofungini]MBJ3809553.1 cytochrome P450 [Streptomyces flavofungini]GHC55489.1 cytochrome P450 [Streptomyces flavofungini]